MTDRKVGDFDWAKRNPEQQRQYDELMNSSRGVGIYEPDLEAVRQAKMRRNRIAEMAMQGLLASAPEKLNADSHAAIAKFSVEMADALIAELDK